jgi:hypothetical protein
MFVIRLFFALGLPLAAATPFPIVMRHTQVCQPVVEPSLSVIKAFVCDCQPLDFVPEHLVSPGTQHPYVRII